MNITIITGPYLPVATGPSGAVEKRWFGMAKEIQKSGDHNVTIVSRGWPGESRKEIIHGVQFIRVGGYKRSSNLKFDLFRDFLYSLKVLFCLPKSDITVTNTFWLPVLSRLRKKHLGSVVVNVARFPKNQMWLYKHCQRLSAVSTAVSDEIILQTPSVKGIVKIIPNPVDINIFKPSHPFPPEEKRFRILYTGRVHPEKGLHLLIPALGMLIHKFPNLELAVVGPVKVEHGGGGEEYLASLKSLASGLVVNFEEAITQPDKLASRMMMADFYCYPSLADKGESFGIAPLEAMALGFAPILSNLSCFNEFSRDEENCFVFDHGKPEPINELMKTLDQVLSQSTSLRSYGANAVTTAQKFSYENIAQMYINDWTGLLKSK